MSVVTNLILSVGVLDGQGAETRMVTVSRQNAAFNR